MPPVPPLDPLPPWLALPLCALVGRLVLSLLPPGNPGARRGSELPGVWAASLALGLWAVAYERAALDALGLPSNPYVLLVLWTPVAVLRNLTLPASVVPRHEPPETPGGRAGDVLRVLTWLALAVALVVRGVEATLLEGALLALALEALRLVRVLPVARAATALAGALWIAAHGPLAPPTELLVLPAGAALGVLGGLAWVRRADRRGRALALLVPAVMLGADPRAAAFAVGTWVALLVVGPRPRLLETARGVLGAGALGALPLLALDGAPTALPEGFDQASALFLVVVVPVALVRQLGPRGARREVLWILLVGVLPLVLGLDRLAGWRAAGPLPEGFSQGQVHAWTVFAGPLGWVLFGLALLPTDPLARREPVVVGSFPRGEGPYADGPHAPGSGTDGTGALEGGA